MRDASRQQPGSMSSHSHPQPVKLGFCRLKLYHVLFDEAATMAVHFNTSLHHRLKKKTFKILEVCVGFLETYLGKAGVTFTTTAATVACRNCA